MLVLLAQLAYNLLSWIRNLLATHRPSLRSYGPLRIVRDLLHITGMIRLDSQGRILEITFKRAHALASPLQRALSSSLVRDDIVLNLGQI